MLHNGLASGLIQASGDTLSIGCSGFGGAAFQVLGIFTGTLQFEGSVDGLTFRALNVVPINASTAQTSTTAVGIFQAGIAGLSVVRARCSAFTSGPIEVRISVGTASPSGIGGTSSGGTSSTIGAVFPATATAIGFIDSGGNMAGGNLDAGGNLKTTTAATVATTSTLTNVAESAANVTVLAANAARLGFTIVNDSDSAVNFKCGATASATSYTKRVLPRGEFKSSDLGFNYTGKIDAIWDTTPGTAGHASARIDEFTA